MSGAGEMKPCPFCGQNNWDEIWNLHKNVVGYKCLACSNDFIGNPNDSYCWKRIESLEAALKEIKRQCEFIKEHAHEGDKVICNVGQIEKQIALALKGA